MTSPEAGRGLFLSKDRLLKAQKLIRKQKQAGKPISCLRFSFLRSYLHTGEKEYPKDDFI